MGYNRIIGPVSFIEGVLRDPQGATRMLSVFNRSLKLIFARISRGPDSDANWAGALLQQADACAGRDPRGAAQLRGTALIYLGVER